MHHDDIDENPAVKALIAAATAVDDALPGAWSRVADYLDAVNDPQGVIGKRKLDADTVAVLTTGDVQTVIDALEALLEAHTGPEEPGEADTPDAWTEAAADVYELSWKELGEKAIRTVAEALHPHINEMAEGVAVSELEAAAAAVTAAVTPLLETMIRQAAVDTALAEAGEHSLDCHGFTASNRIALAVAQGLGVDEVGGERGACGPTLVVDGLAELTGKVDELLARTAPDTNPGNFFYFDDEGNRVEGERPDDAVAELKAAAARGEFIKRSARAGKLEAFAVPVIPAPGAPRAARDLVTYIENARVGDEAEWDAFTAAVLADGRVHSDAELGLTDVLGQLRTVVEAAQEAMGAEPGSWDEEATDGSV